MQDMDLLFHSLQERRITLSLWQPGNMACNAPICWVNRSSGQTGRAWRPQQLTLARLDKQWCLFKSCVLAATPIESFEHFQSNKLIILSCRYMSTQKNRQMDVYTNLAGRSQNVACWKRPAWMKQPQCSFQQHWTSTPRQTCGSVDGKPII